MSNYDNNRRSEIATITNTFLDTLKKHYNGQKINNTTLATKHAWGSLDLSAEEHDMGVAAYNVIQNTVDETIGLIASTEEFTEKGFILTDAQKLAAKLIAPLVINPEDYASRLGKLKSDPNATVISAESMGIDDIVPLADYQRLSLKNIEVSQEAYDGQKQNNSIFYSIAYNLAAARQDDFGEAFFPTITIDPTQEGVAVSIEFTTLYKDFSRSITGSADREKFEKIPVVKAIYNNAIFATDKNQLIPVYRENDNADMFLASETYDDKQTGSTITTAPLLFGKNISLLGISQTDEQLAKGVMDNTDALDRTITLRNVYFSLQGTDMFKFDANLYTYNNFIYNPQNHHKDMILTFRPNAISINISNFKTSKGEESTVLSALAENYANYIVILEANIHGEANTAYGDIAVFGNNIALKEIKNAAGELVSKTDEAYTAIAEVFNTIKFEGYTVDAFRTNSNIRTRGKLVTNDIYQQYYKITLRSGITALYPVNNFTGMDNDAGMLTSQVQLAGITTSAYAVQTLTNFEAQMNSAQVNGGLDAMEFNGISRYLVNPWFRSSSFDLSSVIDSVMSSHRDVDIREALRLRIKNEVLEMYIQSNYGAAFEVARGNLGGKVGVIIGTDPRLKNILCHDDSRIMLGDNFEAHVVSTLNPLVANKIFITFGVFDQDRNTTINPYGFGNCIWAPTAVFEVAKTTSNAVSRELHNQPRFAHIIHLPILSVWYVSDVQNVYNKIAVNVNDVSPL